MIVQPYENVVNVQSQLPEGYIDMYQPSHRRCTIRTLCGEGISG